MSPEEKFNQEPKGKSGPTTANNFESFDLWGQANFVLWSNARYDFEMIAELIRYKKSTKSCLELFDTVNKHIKNAHEDTFFDGTIKSLKYLVKNNFLNITDLPSLTDDEKYLIELLKRYLKRLDIMELVADIEEPTLRAMLLEYPNLFKEILKDNPLAGHLISKAMLKNGITNLDDLLKKVDNGLNSIEVDRDKNSKEAMKCKLIYLGLRVNNGQIKILSSETLNHFKFITDGSIEHETYSKSVFNSIYAAFYGSDEWNKDKKTHLTGCEALYLDFQLLFLPNNHMSMIYDIFLKEEVDKIGIKYFGKTYRPEGFIATLAIKMVVVIILFRTENFIPVGEKEEVSIFTSAIMLRSLNYAVEKTGQKQNPLRLKGWFLNYFRSELDKRVAFIKLKIDKCISIIQMWGITRAIYLPVFESFRFFCSKIPLDVLEQIIRLFRNRTIDNKIKDDILINFVINIQKIVSADRPAGIEISKEEKYVKDAFILLISKTFENLVKKTVRSLKLHPSTKSYYEKDDLFSDANIAIIELILNFDLSKNNSFIGYLNYNLHLKIKTSSRAKKTDQYTITEDKLKENFLENIPDANDIINSLDDQNNLKMIKDYIEKLPEKEKEAIRKIAKDNEKLSDTERRAKNRGLNRIREMMSTS